MNGTGKVVCVTGASGYIASWLVKLLLQRGYTVKATVRDPYDPKKTQHLVSLNGAKERLHLFKAELLDDGCFDSIVDGCQCVFHTASPVIFSATDPQAEIIDPAIKGTLNVLKSCAKVPSIKRVVITASTASMFFNGRPLTPDVVVDETWFSDSSFCEQNKLWYMLSKTLAEEAAWKFARDNRMDLVILNPGFVVGPLLQPALNRTSEWVLDLAKGKHTFPISTYRFVDVRDVAYAHIQAFEIPSATGRYCLVERVIQFQEILKTLNELFPTLGLQEKCKDHNKPLERTYQISQEKAKGLGLSFIPWELWYMVSKTLAEEAVWRFAKDNRIDLVVLNPGIMVGPLSQPTLNSASEVILNLTKGEKTFHSSTFWLIDVQDVAYAHIQAFQIPSATQLQALFRAKINNWLQMENRKIIDDRRIRLAPESVKMCVIKRDWNRVEIRQQDQENTEKDEPGDQFMIMSSPEMKLKSED